MTKQSYLPSLIAAVALIAACNNSNNCGLPSGGTCTNTSCGGHSGNFAGDTLWKTDVPKDLADSAATATVTAIFGFASTPTSADSAAITSSGGTIATGIELSASNLLLATYTASKLIALADTYTGSAILSVTLPQGYFQNGSSSGCPVTGT